MLSVGVDWCLCLVIEGSAELRVLGWSQGVADPYLHVFRLELPAWVKVANHVHHIDEFGVCERQPPPGIRFCTGRMNGRLMTTSDPKVVWVDWPVCRQSRILCRALLRSSGGFNIFPRVRAKLAQVDHLVVVLNEPDVFAG